MEWIEEGFWRPSARQLGRAYSWMSPPSLSRRRVAPAHQQSAAHQDVGVCWNHDTGPPRPLFAGRAVVSVPPVVARPAAGPGRSSGGGRGRDASAATSQAGRETTAGALRQKLDERRQHGDPLTWRRGQATWRLSTLQLMSKKKDRHLLRPLVATKEMSSSSRRRTAQYRNDRITSSRDRVRIHGPYAPGRFSDPLPRLQLKWLPSRCDACVLGTHNLSKQEIIRCLERYIARETYKLVTAKKPPVRNMRASVQIAAAVERATPVTSPKAASRGGAIRITPPREAASEASFNSRARCCICRARSSARSAAFAARS
jgi:hypothetical protein